MGWFKQLCLSWIILSVAAARVSCQELTSTLREGNRTCPGEEVIFTCTVRGPSSLAVLNLAWSSAEYISRSLQLSTTNGLGAEETSSDMDGNTTATATVTDIANVTGELILESTLLITAVEASTVTCTSGADRGTASIEFHISVLPGVPDITAREISQPVENTCIILVQWASPTNSDASDIAQYIVYVPSRNVEMTASSSFTFTSLTVSNCDDDIRVQVAAVNRDGCVGMNSSEVQPTLINIPTLPTDEGATTTEGGSASTSSQLGAGPIAGITLVVILVVVGIGILIAIVIYFSFKHFKQEQIDGEILIGRYGSSRIHADDGSGVEETHGSHLIKESLLSLYFALRPHSARSTVIMTGMQKDSFITRTMVTLRAELKKAKAIDVRDGLKNSLEELKEEKGEVLQRVLDYLLEIFPDNFMSSIDDELRRNIEELRKSPIIKSDVEELRDKEKSPSIKSDVEELRDKEKSPSIKDALDNMIEKVDWPTPDEIKRILLRLCDALFEKFLKLSPKQNEVVNIFEISLRSLKGVERLLATEFTKGLESEGEDVNVKMLVTHVHEMPKGTEEGEFLVVDLGVHHLRVLHIIIIKGGIKKKDCKEEFFISDDTKSSSYESLFDFIVNCIAKFIKDRNIKKKLPIGFTFPFPMNHESLTCGKLIRWTRDFKVTGAEGKDVVQLLKEAASRRGDMEINVVALINNTIGILLSVGSEVPDCHIGLALGDGANACYMEEVDAIPKFGGYRRHSKVIVNTEWGAFGDDGKLNDWRNNYDRLLDDHSSNPEQQIFGKMISDKYQGRIVYLILKDLISKGELFGGESSPRFDNFKEFSTQRLSTMEGWDMEKCKKLFKNRFGIEASIKDCEVIRRVCVAVSTRAARLAAAGIVALVKKINKTNGCTVAVDGSLYKRDPFPDRLRDALDELEPMSNIKMKLTEEGSSIGAAFAAAMNYSGSPPSLSPRSPSPEGYAVLEGPKELTSTDIEVHPKPSDNIELENLA